MVKIPLNDKSVPLFAGWRNGEFDIDPALWKKAKRTGLLMGKISGNIQAVDIDLKYDLTGTLAKDYADAVNEIDNTIFPKLVVQKTKSQGYHLIFACSQVEGNLKLASRPANEEEMADGEKVKVLIETRGEGGYIVVESDGYKVVKGSLDEIQEITPEQMDTLFGVARDFNQIEKKVFTPAKKHLPKEKGLTPFEEYNRRGEVIQLLQNHGWKETGQRGSKILLKRPGSTDYSHSGNFDQDKNWFSVFSTSTEFEVETPYLPYAVYAILECGGDFTKASHQLYEEGFGDRREVKKEVNAQVPSKIDVTEDVDDFFVTRKEITAYFQDLKAGRIQTGLSTGIKSLDPYLRFKRGNLVIVNGIDNVGKTVCIVYLAMLSALLHGWRWIIFSSENSATGLSRKIAEFYWNKEFKWLTQDETDEAMTFIENHFSFIKCEEDTFNYQDILNIVKAKHNHAPHDALLIDPYNSLSIDMPSNSKLSTHEYHYEAISKIKAFGRKEDISTYINCHAITNSLRQKDGDGHPTAPLKADTEGGGKFGNKADEFITIHRKTGHPDEFMITEFHIRKVKETETGGRVTPFKEPVRIKMLPGNTGFIEDDHGFARNPIKEIRFPEDRPEPIIHNIADEKEEYSDEIPF